MSEKQGSTERILSEIKARQDQDKIIRMEEEKTKLVIFSIRNDIYAFYGTDIREILRYEEIAWVPGCPAMIMGIINVRGDIESVINLHRLLKLPDPEITAETRIAIARTGSLRSGILVDAVLDVLDVPVNDIKPPVSTLDPLVREFAVGGETIHADRYVTLLDVGKIFGKIIPEA